MNTENSKTNESKNFLFEFTDKFDKFDLPDGSCSISDIQDYFEYIIKKQENIADNPPVQIYINKKKQNCF